MRLTRTTGKYVTFPIGRPQEAVDWEDFIITKNPDGSRTAMTLSRFPRSSIVRHVVQTVDKDFRSIDGFARLFSEGKFLGSIARYVREGRLISTVFPPDGGPADPFETEFDQDREVLGYHPTSVEGWKFQRMDLSQKGPQSIHLFTTSLTWNGGAMGHGLRVEMSVEYLGDEDLQVAGESFPCRHYIWRTGDIDGDLDIWTTGDDQILVRMLGHRKGHCYELSSIAVTHFDNVSEFPDY